MRELYHLYNGPDAPWPPAQPRRLKAFVYGCALYAHEQAQKMASQGGGGGMG